MESELVNVLYGKFAADKTVQVHVEVQAAHLGFRCNQRISLQNLDEALHDRYGRRQIDQVGFL
jgi:hypothetical protein